MEFAVEVGVAYKDNLVEHASVVDSAVACQHCPVAPKDLDSELGFVVECAVVKSVDFVEFAA